MSAYKSRSTPEGQAQPPEVHYHILMSSPELVVLRHSHVWRPPTDVMEDDERLIVVVEVAGMHNGEFHITLGGQRLTISGVRTASPQHCSAYHQLEVRYGEFRTDVALPWPVDEEGVLARYEDGFLRIELPRARAQRIKVISVDRPAADLGPGIDK